ncbi:hypothetical protein ACWKSP_10985 [Micromonosporaceae bacterium Da 78-11]
MTYAALVLMALGWPVIAVGASVMGVLGLALLGVGNAGRAAPGWWLTAGAVSAAIASYGYGLRRTTSLSMADFDDRCRLAFRAAHRTGFSADADGVESFWPLHDTTCGPELVPAWVTPVTLGFAASAVVILALTIWIKVRGRARNRAGSTAGS